MEQIKNELFKRLIKIYKNEDIAREALIKIFDRFQDLEILNNKEMDLSEKDTMLITYGDSLRSKDERPLRTLNRFMNRYVGSVFSSVHILPMFPYTSDDGFSVVDYKAIDKELGEWEDIHSLSKHYKLMFDAVVNHISKSSEWFRKFLDGEEKYEKYFINADPKEDYSKVTRPRALPLLTQFETKGGTKYVWTTFSDDQIDLNYKSIDLLVDVLDILVYYAKNGAKYIRLDAIGFMWKKIGTTCMHLEETHELVKLMRDILDLYAPSTLIITETNVPHKDNISYFGNGYDEAQLVYQFPLPVLTLFSFLSGNAEKLSKWAMDLETLTPRTTYFNFLSSHDGIGMRPADGILTRSEIDMLVEKTLRHGGRVSYKDNGDGTKSPYELNITYQDALTSPNEPDDIREKRFIAAHTLLLSVVGVPGIYIHSLLGSRNYYYGVETSGINRRINREKLDYNELVNELDADSSRRRIFDEIIRRISIRKEQSAFSPYSLQEVLMLDNRIFAAKRENVETKEAIYVFINVSTEKVKINLEIDGVDLLTGKQVKNEVCLDGLQAMWIK